MLKTAICTWPAWWRRPCITKTLLVMKLTLVLLTVGFLNVHAKGLSQNIHFSGKNVPLESVFSSVEKQTGFVFMYKESLLKASRPVSIQAKNLPLEQFLSEIFKTQPFDYIIKGKSIFISPKPISGSSDRQLNRSGTDLLIHAYTLIAVRGRVVDEKAAPIEGISVRVKGTNAGTTTDRSGEFSLNLPAGSTLVLTGVAYQTQEVLVTEQTYLVVVMKPKINKLDTSVIVSTGYQTIPRERATGSFGIVTAKQLAQIPTVSLFERLQGLVPGMNISTKTTAGKSRNGSITIRGLSTIVSSSSRVSTDPLLVIDGFPSQLSISAGGLDFMNPDDIEQITVLKDAAAASIWGIQAANGVIVITTKKGIRNSKPAISFSATFGTSEKPGTGYGKMMSVPEYIELEQELIDKGSLSDPYPITSGFLPENNSQAQAIYWRFKRGEITREELNQQLALLGANDNSGQVADLLLQSPTTQQYSLSISGGGVNSSYFMSGYFYSEDRVYRNNKNQGYSMTIGSNSSFGNGRFTLSSSLMVSNKKDRINNAAVRALSMNPVGGLRPYDMLINPDGSTKYYDVITTPHVARNLESKGYLPFAYSPLDELQYSNTIPNSTNIALNVSLNGNITSWLSASVAGNIGRIFSESETYWEPESYEARNLVNRGTSINAAGVRVNGVPVGGRLDLSNGLGRSYNIRGQINVNETFGTLHNISMVLGNEIRETFSKSSGELRYGYDKSINSFRTVNPTAPYIDINNNTQRIGATSREVVERTTRALSYYGNAAYTFDGKYTVSASARFDDYNLLGVERRKRAIPLWSAGARWNIKNEQFMEAISFVDQLSARFTYGFSGNAPQGYAPVTVINLLGNDFFTGYPYGVIATPAINNLAWEKTRMTNYGIDFSLFKNRIAGSIEYYKKLSTDILWTLPINGTYGFNNSLFNTATLNGEGFDFGLSVVPVLTKNFRWSSTLNVSYNTNEIRDTRFKAPVGSLSSDFIYDGYPTDYLFSYIWAGLDATGQSLIRDPKDPAKTYTVEEYPYYDIREYSGRTSSPWFGSFSSSFQYKGWELSFQLQYFLGGVFRKTSNSMAGSYVGRSGDLAARWRNPGDEKFTNVPGFVFGGTSNYYLSSERYAESNLMVESRSNVKLQQIMVNYSVPKSLLTKAGMKGMSLSLAARNLGMIWAANKDKVDPDYLYLANTNYQLAPVTNYTFRVGINF
jgi:TonB-linked SusC/RagA family outer membrane protein